MSVVRKIKKPTVAKKPLRRIGDAVFKMIVEMAYEMKHANRYCEAERTNRFVGLPSLWNVNLVVGKAELPFEVETKDYKDAKIGDIIINAHFPRNYKDWVMTRLAKVVRINKKSISLADCDQDGQLIEYNPDEDCDYPTKEARKDYNKVFPNLRINYIVVLTGTKHLRYDGWDS